MYYVPPFGDKEQFAVSDSDFPTEARIINVASSLKLL